MLASRPCRAEGRRLRYGGQWHPGAAARDSGGADQGLPGQDAPPGGAVSGPQAETQDQHGGQSAGRRRSETGPQAQSPGIQQEGTRSWSPVPADPYLELYMSCCCCCCCSEPNADTTDHSLTHRRASLRWSRFSATSLT